MVVARKFNLKQTAAATVFVAWLILLVVAFYRFFFANLASFDQWATFDGSKLSTIAKVAPGTIVHWSGSDCICNRYSEPHVAELQQRLDHYHHELIDLGVDTGRFANLAQFVPATPAVMVFDQDGKLAYFGPYSGGTVCGEGEDFVTRTDEMLRAGVNPH